MIAADLLIDVKTAALLSTAFTFPYALMQPVLGITADFFGKTRLMNMCLLVVCARGAGLRGGDRAFAGVRHAGRGRAGRRRRVSGGDGA